MTATTALIESPPRALQHEGIDLTCTAAPTPSSLQYEGAWTVADLERLCARYHSAKGAFAYRAVDWLDTTVFDGLPLPLIQWALTAWGRCLGHTRSRPDDVPVVTLHPAVWARSPDSDDDGRGWAEQIIPGPRLTLDLILHELVHVEVTYRRGGWRGHSSHDNPEWCGAIEAASARLRGTMLALPPFTARPTGRRRDADGRSRRTVPEGCLPMARVATWPQSLREPSYYRDTAVPFAVPSDDRLPRVKATA